MAKEVKDDAAIVETTPVAEASTYVASELIENHKAFDQPKECVSAALKCAGIKRATFDEAKAAIDKFMRKVIR